MKLEDWQPKKQERKLLKAYCENFDLSALALEVPVGLSRNWGAEAQTRYIDGVLLFERGEREEKEVKVIRPGFESLNTLLEVSQFEKVQIVEVKRKLNRPVIGQAIAGEVMFKKDYPKINEVNKVVVCERADSALLEVCEELNIKVAQIDL